MVERDTQGRLRIVIATRIYDPEPAAAALRLKALAEALASLGHDVEVLTTRTKGAPKRELRRFQRGSIRVKRMPVLRDGTGSVRGYIPYLSFDVPLFFRLLTCRRPSVVVNEPPPTTGCVTRLVCRTRGVPYVYFAGDIVSDAARSQRTPELVVRTVAWMEAFALRQARQVIAVSDGVAQRVQSLAGRSAQVVPNGIDTSGGPISGDSPVPQGFPKTEGPVFLYAGTVAQWLAPEVFIEAFRKARGYIKGAKLVFLGQGSAWRSLEKMAAGDADIEFHDSVDAGTARLWCAHADVCLASIRQGAYDYAYPTKILTSLASGTPVIYAGPGQARDDVRENCLGIAVDLNADEVAQAMIDMSRLSDEDPRRDSRRLHQWVERNRSVKVSSNLAADVVLSAVQ
ncbi:glycosyltransferase [Schaalia vaccimaxillae]|uniref:glycosyltransferase n=1 Tax=Schaalia vaccimaxillae TaxID=183916 RepID=UPI0003B49F71|nr:glycosyltransferase [Schaalia vaccimaxillae]